MNFTPNQGLNPTRATPGNRATEVREGACRSPMLGRESRERLPGGGFVNGSTGNWARKLAGSKNALPDGPYEMCMRFELLGCSPLFRRNQTDNFGWMMKSGESHSFGKVAIIGYHHGAIVSVKPCVVQEVHRKVDIRSFLFGLYDGFMGFSGDGLSQGSLYFMTEKMPIVDFNLGNVGTESTKVDFLPEGLVWILRGRGNQGSEILDAGDDMSGFENLAEERLQVEPFVRSASYGSVVEIEPIHVNGCSHHPSHEKAGAPEGAPRPKVETLGGATNLLSFHGFYNQSAAALQEAMWIGYTTSPSMA